MILGVAVVLTWWAGFTAHAIFRGEGAGPDSNSMILGGSSGRFPEAYLGDFDGELDFITYEWQTHRYPVNADIQ